MLFKKDLKVTCGSSRTKVLIDTMEKSFKQYKLLDGEEEINSMMNLNWLYSDSQGRLWEIGKQGRVFCYESKHDRFQLTYKLPKSETEGLHTPVSYGFVDANNTIWLCNQRKHYGYRADRCHPLFHRNGRRRTLRRAEKRHTRAESLRKAGYAKVTNQRAFLS